MHCKQCDRELTDFEATRMDLRDGTYVDLCNDCFAVVAQFIPVRERPDLYDSETDEWTDNSDGEVSLQDLQLTIPPESRD